jgi:ribosomal protein S18 acetylase RimI-like enzyme
MSAAATGPRPVGVIWHLAQPSRPAAPSATLPARFGRVEPEAEAELAEVIGRGALALVRQRFEAGRRCYAAWTRDQLAAYGWVSFGEEHVGELGLHLRLLPDEAYIWDCLTLPAYQRRGLYAGLLSHMAQALQAAGVQAIWIGADYDNRPSQAGIARAGFTAVAELVAAPPLPGERRRRGWLQARPGIRPEQLAQARRVYLGDQDQVWLLADTA